MLQSRPDPNRFHEFILTRNRPIAMHSSFRGFPGAAFLGAFVFIVNAFPWVSIPQNRPLGAAEIGVDNVRGSDLQAISDGQRIQAPYRTLQRAIDHAILGDRIKLIPTGQPYRECVSINTRNDFSTPDFPLVIDGNGATLDGTRPLGVLDWSAIGADLFELKVRSPGHDLTIVGYRLDGINCHDLVSNVRFENIVAADNGRSGISVGGASRVLLANSKLADNGDSQVRVEGQSLLELSNVTLNDDVSQAIDRAGGRVIELR